ncbi:hypothetical protein FR943_04235 [Mycobacterium sp. TNTM28]|uniref:Uncharacterized protein n=1 Tax=[Mycobacterium] fortunisiensis TaxID=2600579 RepID=A0ABS6KHM3_9MYCO|nr:hypothetical protein [[Mycobacterium] fortunisiensis]MBU9763057.1 hypothetical protein [[Mycobacterium] fortunisiensis]
MAIAIPEKVVFSTDSRLSTMETPRLDFVTSAMLRRMLAAADAQLDAISGKISASVSFAPNLESLTLA